MLDEPVQRAADQHPEQDIVRAEAIDAWASLALEQPDPGDWTDALVAAALDRLATTPEQLPVKAAARQRLLDIHGAVKSVIAKQLAETRVSA